MFIAIIEFIGLNANANLLKCVSMSTQECKIGPPITNINSNETLFYPYSILINACSGSRNDINNPYAKLCFPDVVKNMNITVLNLMSRTNVTRHESWHKTCLCKCRFDVSVCNNKQRWNNDKWKFKWKELIEKSRCDDGFIWNPSMCECECDKWCNFDEYLDYANCEYRQKMIDKFVLQCEHEILNATNTIYNW